MTIEDKFIMPVRGELEVYEPVFSDKALSNIKMVTMEGSPCWTLDNPPEPLKYIQVGTHFQTSGLLGETLKGEVLELGDPEHSHRPVARAISGDFGLMLEEFKFGWVLVGMLDNRRIKQMDFS